MMDRRARRVFLAALAPALLLTAEPARAAAACTPGVDAVRIARSASEAAAGARDALILARRAAQDWKNLLLRGGDAVERPRMQARLDAQALGYEKQLTLLGSQLASTGTGRQLHLRLDEERKRMFSAYRQALETRGAHDLASAALADRDVQGVDVPTFRALEELIGILDKLTSEQFGQAYIVIGRCEQPQ